MNETPSPWSLADRRWDAHVDYVTLVSKTEKPGIVYQAVTALGARAQADLDPLERPRPRKLLGYDGMSTASVYYGLREDGCVFRVSGGGAHKYFASFLSPVWHCTRLDMALDVWDMGDPDSVIENAFHRAVEFRESRVGIFRRRIAHINGAGNGDTLNVGARSSSRFIRVYNKGAQSSEEAYSGCVRFEIQYNGVVAAAAWQDVTTRRPVEDVIGVQVCHEMTQAGVPMVLPSSSLPAARLGVSRGNSDAYKRLEWLHTQVRPVVRQIIDRLGVGAVLAALDIRDEDMDRL